MRRREWHEGEMNMLYVAATRAERILFTNAILRNLQPGEEKSFFGQAQPPHYEDPGGPPPGDSKGNTGSSQEAARQSQRELLLERRRENEGTWKRFDAHPPPPFTSVAQLPIPRGPPNDLTNILCADPALSFEHEEIRQLFRDYLLRWHPDRWAVHLRRRQVDPSSQFGKEVLEEVKKVAQQLNDLRDNWRPEGEEDEGDAATGSAGTDSDD
mmetsp:Transcript_21391/g.42474  ORF Transcript_21391/g.42474 Transcript_21391/m.42474 type:complete len:212 (+) Transcript_21391:129-764(+)